MSSTIGTTNVTLTAISQPTPSETILVYSYQHDVYTYEDALNDVLGYGSPEYPGSPPEPLNNTFFLWESGCRVGKTRNCTLACSDTHDGHNMVWNSSEAMFTLHNCLVYPILATAAAHGWLEQHPPSLLDNFGINPSKMLSVDNTTNAETDRLAWRVIFDCVQSACASYYGEASVDTCYQNQTMDTTYRAGPSDRIWNISLAYDGALDLCSIDASAPNADIGGPGVLISILQQVTILMVIWLLLSSSQWLRAALLTCSRRVPIFGARRLERLLVPGNQTAALITTLQEFQRIRVFLLLALQAVTLLILNHATWLDVSTDVQLVNNDLLMMYLSTAGVYPITLGLLTLRKTKGTLEWFTLVTSLACVIVSSVTWARVRQIDVATQQLRQEDPSLYQCGGINPKRYCSSGESLRGSVRASLVHQEMSIGPICALLYLFLEKALPSKIRHKKVWTPTWTRHVLYAAQRQFVCIPRRPIKALRLAALLCAKALLLWGNIMIFTQLYELLHASSDGSRVWTIGQILSVSVWVPMLLEWMYSALRGIEANFSIRLPRNYKVIKVDTGNVDSSSNDTTRPSSPQSAVQQSTSTPTV